MVIERSLTQVAGRRTQVCQSQRLLGTCSLKRKLAPLANGSENMLSGSNFQAQETEESGQTCWSNGPAAPLSRLLDFYSDIREGLRAVSGLLPSS